MTTKVSGGCRLLVLLLLSTLVVSCAPVKPWQREYLARDHMAFDPDPLDQKSKQHMYFSREATSGGYGIGGGGCGCN